MNVFNHFQMFKPVRRGALQIQTREPIRSIRVASNFTERPWQEMAKEVTVRIKTFKVKMNIIQHIAWALYRRYSDVTPFVIINIFIINFNLITHPFLGTDYSYIYLSLNCIILLHVTGYSPTLISVHISLFLLVS